MKNIPKVAVVILNWNGQHWLQKFLPSVLSSTYSNLEIVIGDNASTDSSVAWLQQNYPTVTIIQNKQNFGFAGGYNEVLKHVSAQYFILLNSDVSVTTSWIEPMIQLLESDHLIAAVQPKLLSFDNPDLFEYAGGAGGFIDEFAYPFCAGRMFDTVEKDVNQYDQVKNIFWATGACMAVRASLFTECHGFDQSFFAHQEEIDLCWRLKNKGYKIQLAAESIVYHVGGGMLPKSNPKKTFLNFRNSLIMIAKNATVSEAFKIIIIRLLLDGVAGIKFFIDGKPKDTWAIIKSHLHFYIQIPKIINFRKSQNITPKPLYKHIGVYKGSIVQKYFFQKKTKYCSEIWNEISID